MPKCKRCKKEAPTAMAYGTEVFICCGYPLVNTDRSVRLQQRIEHSRMCNESRIRDYQERIAELERRVGFHDKLKARLGDTDRRVTGLKRLLSDVQRRKVVAMVVVMLKELAHRHTLVQNMDPLGPMPGQAAVTYHALSDALRYALDVSSKDIFDVVELLEPMGPPGVGGGEGLPRDDEAAEEEGEVSDQEPSAEAGDSSSAAKRDIDEFWHGSE